MTLAGVEIQAVSQVQSADIQNRKLSIDVRPSDDATDKAQGRQETRNIAPIQDQVTLSKEAQVLSVSKSQTSENNTFEQSPFDR